jgi:hypothetical protein
MDSKIEAQPGETTDPVNLFSRMWEKADEISRREFPYDTQKQADKRDQHIKEMLCLTNWNDSSPKKYIDVNIKDQSANPAQPESSDCDWIGSILITFGVIALLVFVVMVLIKSIN